MLNKTFFICTLKHKIWTAVCSLTQPPSGLSPESDPDNVPPSVQLHISLGRLKRSRQTLHVLRSAAAVDDNIIQIVCIMCSMRTQHPVHETLEICHD